MSARKTELGGSAASIAGASSSARQAHTKPPNLIAPDGALHVPKPTKTDRRNAFLYCKFRDQQFALYDAFAKRNGLLMKTFLVLNALYYAEGGMAQSEICARTFQSKQTVNLIVKNLLRDGHAAKVADPQDRRSKLVRLTEAGRAYAKDPVTHITWAEDAAMAMFSPEEQEQLISLSRRFTQNLADLVNGTCGSGGAGARGKAARASATAPAAAAYANANEGKGADGKAAAPVYGSEDDR